MKHLANFEVVEIFSRHVEQVNAVWLEDETGARTLREAVIIWLERKLQADPNYDWTTDPGELPPPPTGTPESVRPRHYYLEIILQDDNVLELKMPFHTREQLKQSVETCFDMLSEGYTFRIYSERVGDGSTGMKQ